MAARQRYHHGDLRRALLDGARAILRESGVEALSLRDVARRAGVSHAAPYHHFASRDDLLSTLTREAFGEMDQAMAEAQAAAPNEPEAQLVATGMGYFLYALREPASFRLMMKPRALESASVASGDAEECVGPYRRLERALERLLGVPADLVDIHVCWATVHGLAVLALEGALDAGSEGLPAHAREVLRRLAGGLGSAR